MFARVLLEPHVWMFANPCAPLRTTTITENYVKTTPHTSDPYKKDKPIAAAA